MCGAQGQLEEIERVCRDVLDSTQANSDLWAAMLAKRVWGQAADALLIAAGSVSLARLWQRQGKGVDTHALLSEICNWFTEGFDTADLREARVFLNG